MRIERARAGIEALPGPEQASARDAHEGEHGRRLRQASGQPPRPATPWCGLR
jgi:hypothetical protein